MVHGDGRDQEAVARAVSGADAVIAIVASASRKARADAAATLLDLAESDTYARTAVNVYGA